MILSNLFVKVDSKRKKRDVNSDLHHSHVEGDKEMEIWLYCGTMGCWPAQESGFNGFLAIVLTALHMSAHCTAKLSVSVMQQVGNTPMMSLDANKPINTKGLHTKKLTSLFCFRASAQDFYLNNVARFCRKKTRHKLTFN